MEKVKEDNKRDEISLNRIVKERENSKNERFPARKRRDTNFLDILNNRAQGSFKHESSPRLSLHYRLEAQVASSEYKEMVCQLPGNVGSTFLMTYSSNGEFVATCHADNNIWITEISTGRCIRQYTGHTKAPWCLKFHPSSNSTLASGDFGGELRIWNNDGDIVKWNSNDNSAICSIDFHPSKEILAIASGYCIYFWLWKETLFPTGICCTSSEIERPQYVKFYNSGNSFVTGIFNVPKSTCVFVKNKEKVLCDSSNVQIVSSSSVRKNDSQEEVLCDSSNVQIVCSSSVTENNAQEEVLCDSSNIQIVSSFCVTENNFQEEVLSDSNGDDVKILPINTRSLTNEKSSHGYTKENTLSDASDIEIVYTNINPLDGGNRSYSSTEEPKASQNFRNLNTVGKTSASQGQVNNMRNPFNLTVPDWDPDIQTVGVVLKDGKKVDENADVICEYEYIKTPLSKGMKRKRILKHQYVQGTSKRQKTAVQTRSEVMPFAIRKSREMRIVPIEGRIGVSPTIDDNHITVNPFVLNMMRLQSLFSSLNQRLTIFQSFSIPLLENLIFPQFNETAQFENNRFGLFIDNLNNVLPCSYQVLTYVYKRIQQMNGRLDQIMQCSVMYNYQNNTSSEEITQKVHIILRKVLKKECKISMNSLIQLRKRKECNLDPISHCSLSAVSFEDMTLPIARETETCNVQRPECSAFLPLSINSSIPSNDCKEVLACESQDASSPLDEDMSSSDSMHNAHNRPVCSSSSAFLPPNIDSNIPSNDYEKVMVCESQDASSPLVEDMRSSDSMHNAHDRPGCSSSLAFLPPSIDSNIPSSDYEELLVCESQVTSSQIVEDTGSSNIGMENDREEAPDPSGLNSAANLDSDPEIKYLFTVDHLHKGKALPVRPASNQPFSTIENEFLRPYRIEGFKRDVSQALLFCRYSLALTRYVPDPGCPPCPPSYRIQAWPFQVNMLPKIHDAETNIVTRECKIHNDASVDISQDNEKLVAIVLDHENHHYKIAVHSLLPHNLGQLLCIYDPCPNPVSVSISPLSQFIFIGMSAARGAASNFAFPDAEIISIRDENGLCRAVHFRTFEQLYHDRDRVPTYSINVIKWLPETTPGFSFVTNKGSLVICTPET